MFDTPKNQDVSQLPMVALIGPANSGKSTLFNRLTSSWQAITAKEAGTTRDRVYGEVEWNSKKFNLVDTGGLVDDASWSFSSKRFRGHLPETSELNQRVFAQMQKAAAEADIILFVYDAIEGLAEINRQFLNDLRGKNVWLVANKIDSFNREPKAEQHDNLGLPYFEVSGGTGRGTGDLLDAITKKLPKVEPDILPLPVIAIIGRPNVGKSSILNALTKTDRAVVSPIAGTTRDIVTEKITINGQGYLLADTAGVRRRGKIERGPEAFSVKRALTAINQSDCVIVVVDATVGSARGDLHLLYYASSLEKPTVIVFNKTDLVDQKIQFHGHISRFEHLLVSAKTSENISQLADWISEHAKKS